MAPTLNDVLADLGVEVKFHAVLDELCSGESEYLVDIAVQDLEGRQDSEGSPISASMAQDLVHKLGRRQLAVDTLDEADVMVAALPSGKAGGEKDVLLAVPALMRNASNASSEGMAYPAASCSVVSLSRCPAAESDVGLLRCALNAQLPLGNTRCKLLAVVLDRSGSMAGAMWNRVVDGVVSVVTDDLLGDANVSITLIVYADEAREVPLPKKSSELRDLLLSRAFAPHGGTCFKAAFELTRRVLKRELNRLLKDHGAHPKDVDIATLVFTDGEDTSVKTAAARAPEAPQEEPAGDAWVKQFVSLTGANQRTAQYYIEGSLGRGLGLDDAIGYFFERGGALPPPYWAPAAGGGGRRRAAAVPADWRGVTVVDKDASLKAARAAGDAFREALRRTGCASCLCVAAFGEDHNPEQCQYISDRYYYINRGEVLAEVLAGSLGALLNSAGQCSLRFHLPSGLTLEEPLPESLPLDARGRLDHHIWLRAASKPDSADRLTVDFEMAGAVALKESTAMAQISTSNVGSFEGHLCMIDFIALQLRRVARELCGRRPAGEELASLRARLTDAKDKLRPIKEAASVATGLLLGRAALRDRLAEVEAARERLSYALGQFDETDTNDDRKIGSVAIDAILRDAGQHVPPGKAAAESSRRALAVARLPAPEPLSKYGKEYTLDGYSCCDAWDLASQGDALFFQLGAAKPAPGGGFLAAEDSSAFIGHEAFDLLSRGGRQAVRGLGGDTSTAFSHLGVPLFVTPGHFLRVRELLPDVLARLSPAGTYEHGVSQRQLLSLLGRSLAAEPFRSEAQLMALVHKARAVHAVLDCNAAAAASDSDTQSTPRSLLEAVYNDARRFLEEPTSREEYGDLHAIAAAGFLMATENWGEDELERLSTALVEEALRRRLAHGLRSAGAAQRLCLAWGLLGPEDGDCAWLEQAMPCPNAGELCLEDSGFNPFRAPDELELLESTSPGRAAPRKAGAAALLSILSSKRAEADPLPATWATLRRLLPAWGRAMEGFGGAGALWRELDAAMIEEDPVHLESLQVVIAALRLPESCTRPCLMDAFDDAAAAVIRVAASVCLPDLRPGQCLRSFVASSLRALAEHRKALVSKYSISGANFPELEVHSAESVADIWGAPAVPVDSALHHKAMLRVWRRTMKARITMTVKEALADKEYRKRGGKFKFPSPMDTFIRGLHRRTEDLHNDWTGRLQKNTSGDAAREEAVAEMLLRLRWDDSDERARAKLSQIVARIWDGLEGLDLTSTPPLSSALWLDDADVMATPQTGIERPVVLLSSPKGEKENDDNANTLAPPPGLEAECKEDDEDEEDAEVEEENEGSEDDSVPERSVPAMALHEGKGKGKGKSMNKGKGKGKGMKGGFRQVVHGAEEAEAAMDDGLRTAFEGLPEELRSRMEAFARERVAGRRVKLPLDLKAKARKAVHLWAETQGLEHESFGYRGRRRLHLTVPSGAAGDESEGQASAGEEDWA